MSRRPPRLLWRVVAVLVLGAAVLAGLAHVASGQLRRAVAQIVVPAGG